MLFKKYPNIRDVTFEDYEKYNKMHVMATDRYYGMDSQEVIISKLDDIINLLKREHNE